MLFQEPKLDQRFFQRGCTWKECVEEWKQDRDFFLGLHLQVQTLPKLHAALTRLAPSKLLVLYRSLPMGLLTLPALGKTLEQATHLNTRFFSNESFFPRLKPDFRRTPLVLALVKPNNTLEPAWIPEPELDVPSLETLNTGLFLEFLKAMDHSLSKGFRRLAHLSIS